LQVIIREFGPFLFELALGDVPVAFDFEFIHSGSFIVRFDSVGTSFRVSGCQGDR
jgi:hypothetical protein